MATMIPVDMKLPAFTGEADVPASRVPGREGSIALVRLVICHGHRPGAAPLERS
jgi:hypothetical protein